jgi:hypothetical protein
MVPLPASMSARRRRKARQAGLGLERSLAGRGEAGHGAARFGAARLRQGRHGLAWNGRATPGEAGQGEEGRHGKENRRQGWAW